jgi:hypothetical protein
MKSLNQMADDDVVQPLSEGHQGTTLVWKLATGNSKHVGTRVGEDADGRTEPQNNELCIENDFE